MVSGSSLYKVKITIGEVVKAHWTSICTDCSGAINSLVELLQGRFSKGVMERLPSGRGVVPQAFGNSVFVQLPRPCLDVQARGGGSLRCRFPTGCGTDITLQAACGQRERSGCRHRQGAADGQAGASFGKVLEADDIAALFGLDMGDGEAPAEAVVPAASASRRFGRRPRRDQPSERQRGEKSRTSGRDEGKRGRTQASGVVEARGIAANGDGTCCDKRDRETGSGTKGRWWVNAQREL